MNTFRLLKAGFCTMAALAATCGCSRGNDTALQELEMEHRMMAMYGVNKQLPDSAAADPFAVRCVNGVFVGRDSVGVVSFKGIPYAQPPIDSLRWQPPRPAIPSNAVREAFYFGLSPIQTRALSQPGSYYPQGEDCLTLNIWVDDRQMNPESEKCPVMVFIHGGSYGWGATSDPMYDCHNLVEAYPSTILVTVEYRLGMLGFIDFSSVEGGDRFRESGNLGLLDQLCAIRWVKDNITAFGGDPDNITIFGESAGAGSVSLLPLISGSDGLFRRFIAESGSVALTYSPEECQDLTHRLLKRSGAKSMDQLMALSEEQIKELNRHLNHYANFPERDGIVLPTDLYAAYARGDARNVEMLIGTNADEIRYWIRDFGDLFYKIVANLLFENNMRRISKADMKYVNAFMATQHEGKVWDITEFYNELLFRVPAVHQAALHAAAGGKSYVYYWTYPSAIGNLKACHTVELPYVFNNLTDTVCTGNNIDHTLARTVQHMWTTFAATGNPSVPGFPWPEYNAGTRISMVLGRQTHTQSEIMAPQRQDIEPLLKYGFNGDTTTLTLAVPCVINTIAIAITIISLITIAIVALTRRRKRKLKVES